MFDSVSARVHPLREHEHAVGLLPVRERGRRGVDPGGCAVNVVEQDAGHGPRHPLEGGHHHVDRRVGELGQECGLPVVQRPFRERVIEQRVDNGIRRGLDEVDNRRAERA
jgi:hypothetical protein